MDVPPVGSQSPHAATPSANKQEPANAPQEQPRPPQAPPQTAESPPEPARSKAELEQLANEVILIFEDSPERLDELVATLKRLGAGK